MKNKIICRARSPDQGGAQMPLFLIGKFFDRSVKQ